MNISTLERELKKRLAYPYAWGQRQNDALDQQTNFVYRTLHFEQCLAQIETRFAGQPSYQHLYNYALNRWYNFWSAMAVEQIFCALPRVKAHHNAKDRLVDFSIDGIQFDHKTSVYPKGFRTDLEAARREPLRLIDWLYDNQSQQQRKHLHNRLFVVLHARDGEHWKLKAEISWMETMITHYINHFDAAALHRFRFEAGRETLADVIWACT